VCEANDCAEVAHKMPHWGNGDEPSSSWQKCVERQKNVGCRGRFCVVEL